MTSPNTIADGDGQIFVNYQGVNDVSQVLVDATSAIQQMLNEIEQELQPMQASWTGEARDQYAIKKQQWDAAAANMSEILKGGVGTLDDMAHNYNHTDLNIGFRWSQLR